MQFARLVTITMLFASSIEAAAAPFTFTIVADASTPIPGGNGTFRVFNPPVIDGRDLAFLGSDGHLQDGIYTTNGRSLNVVVNRNSPVPGTTGTFSSLGPLYGISNGTVAFFGHDENNRSGVYTNDLNSTTLIANTSTPIPDGVGTFDNFGNPDIDEGNVVFLGTGRINDHVGVYAKVGGTLLKVADQSDTIPDNGSAFTSFGYQPSIAGANVAFQGQSASRFSGIFMGRTFGLVTIADTNTLIPGSTSRFSGFDIRPSIDNGSVSFVGYGPGGFSGIYSDLGGVLTSVVDTNTLIPGSTDRFKVFGPIAIKGNTIAFVGGQTMTSFGLFLSTNGELVKVVGPGDQIQGRTVRFGFAEGRFFDHGNIGFRATFDDGSQAIVFAVPEPSSVVLAGVVVGISGFAITRMGLVRLIRTSVVCR